jgi:predicted ArsR family transcriptional regulator
MAPDDAADTPTREETLTLLETEPMTTETVADELDVPKRAAYRRLSELAEEGRVERREKRHRVVWTLLE